jgi:two-component system, response regulator FlrC
MELARHGLTLADIEQEHILDTLTYCRGNRTRTAKLLHISIRCLRTKLQFYKQSGCNVCASRTGTDDLPARLQSDSVHVKSS